MNFNITTPEYQGFLNTLPQYNYQLKLIKIKPFLQKLCENSIKHLAPNETFEWYIINDIEVANFTEDQNFDLTLYLISTKLPPNINKTDVNFIPQNRFEFIKKSYIKATLKLSYYYIHPRAGDCYYNWFIEILNSNEDINITLMSSDPNIYVIGNDKIIELKQILPQLIINSL